MGYRSEKRKCQAQTKKGAQQLVRRCGSKLGTEDGTNAKTGTGTGVVENRGRGKSSAGQSPGMEAEHSAEVEAQRKRRRKGTEGKEAEVVRGVSKKGLEVVGLDEKVIAPRGFTWDDPEAEDPFEQLDKEWEEASRAKKEGTGNLGRRGGSGIGDRSGGPAGGSWRHEEPLRGEGSGCGVIGRIQEEDRGQQNKGYRTKGSRAKKGPSSGRNREDGSVGTACYR